MKITRAIFLLITLFFFLIILSSIAKKKILNSNGASNYYSNMAELPFFCSRYYYTSGKSECYTERKHFLSTELRETFCEPPAFDGYANTDKVYKCNDVNLFVYLLGSGGIKK